ncbi:hypothetical protein IR145_10265, partial [Streptococcus danieliae]|nr:hypothetical protein [Streptococcus danieliae]
MTNMSKFAEHVISIANANEIPITNLQLQKTMYFALRNSKDVLDDETIQSIYDEPFLVWRY